jgi:hypothetical protein
MPRSLIRFPTAGRKKAVEKRAKKKARRTKKSPTRRKAKKKSARSRRKLPARRKRAELVATRPAIPRRRKGESKTAYHDRLSSLIFEADKAGDEELSAALQEKAGTLALEDRRLRERPRRRGVRGPGSYPWEQCVKEQTIRYGDAERAKRVCGRIRADSHKRYPVYWSIRDSGPRTRRANPSESDAQFAIVVQPSISNPGQYHYWAEDLKKRRMAAASTKPYSSEEEAERAARRALVKYAGGRPKSGGSTKKTSRRRLPGVLTRL